MEEIMKMVVTGMARGADEFELATAVSEASLLSLQESLDFIESYKQFRDKKEKCNCDFITKGIAELNANSPSVN